MKMVVLGICRHILTEVHVLLLQKVVILKYSAPRSFREAKDERSGYCHENGAPWNMPSYSDGGTCSAAAQSGNLEIFCASLFSRSERRAKRLLS